MFADMKVGTRLAMAFGAVLLLLVGVVVTGISRLSVVNDHLHAITDENNVESRYAKEIRTDAFKVGVTARDIIITTDDATLKAHRVHLEEAARNLDGAVEKLDQLFNSLAATTPTEKELMAKIKDMVPRLQGDGDQGCGSRGSQQERRGDRPAAQRLRSARRGAEPGGGEAGGLRG